MQVPINWESFYNDFDKVVLLAYPEIRCIKQTLNDEKLGAVIDSDTKEEYGKIIDENTSWLDLNKMASKAGSKTSKFIVWVIFPVAYIIPFLLTQPVSSQLSEVERVRTYPRVERE